MIDSKVFRTFVMTNDGALITYLIVLLDEVAFNHLEARLAKLLIEDGGEINSRTHQLMADELGTAQEVASRQLKRFEQKGWLILGRGQVEISDRAKSIRLANS